MVLRASMMADGGMSANGTKLPYQRRRPMSEVGGSGYAAMAESDPLLT
jgi:hypothetical protein